MQLEDRIDRRLSEHDRHLLQLDEKVDLTIRILQDGSNDRLGIVAPFINLNFIFTHG